MTINADPPKNLIEYKIPIDEELWEKLQTIARQQDLPLEAILRRAVIEFLHDHPQG